MRLTNEQKKNIANALADYVSRYPSRNKAATALNVAASTVGAMLNGDWEKISTDMWRKIEAATLHNNTAAAEWQIAETRAFKDIDFVLRDAQEAAGVTWIVGDAGCGKTTTARHYAGTHRNVYYVLCSEDTKRADFVRDIAREMGLRVDGCVRQMFEQVLGALVRVDSPLLIFDEADKLTDSVMQYFITIYNRTEGECGIVFLSTGHIKRRMAGGLQYNRRGYHELNSRIGRRFFELDATPATDVVAVCRANGITDDATIRRIASDTSAYEHDMRRVKRLIRMALKEQAAA